MANSSPKRIAPRLRLISNVAIEADMVLGGYLVECAMLVDKESLKGHQREINDEVRWTSSYRWCQIVSVQILKCINAIFPSVF